MIEKVISGGQTGADQGGLFAARKAGIPTGGWAPVGWLIETGSAPWLGEEFGLRECLEPDFDRPPGMPHWKYHAICYVARTKANARDSDATIWFGRGDSRGFACTEKACEAAERPLIVVATRKLQPSDAATYLMGYRVRTLNVAGNRESSSPGICKKVEAYLAEVFRCLADIN